MKKTLLIVSLLAATCAVQSAHAQAAAAAIAGAVGSMSIQPQPTAPTPSLAEAQSKFKAAIANEVADPDSLRFDTMRVWLHPRGYYVSCGQLRARNGFGGMQRVEYVVTSDKNGKSLVMFGDVAQMAWPRACLGEEIQ